MYILSEYISIYTHVKATLYNFYNYSWRVNIIIVSRNFSDYYNKTILVAYCLDFWCHNIHIRIYKCVCVWNFVCLCVWVYVCLCDLRTISRHSDRFFNTLSSAKAQDHLLILSILLLLFTICCCFRFHCCRNGTVVGPTATCKHSKDVCGSSWIATKFLN